MRATTTTEDLPSTKPYLLRAIWEWCSDNGFTPYVAVVVDESTRVPREFVRDGQIVLNLGPVAANKLQMGNEFIDFHARFGGVARQISIPVGRIIAIYARENGTGMSFDLEDPPEDRGYELASGATIVLENPPDGDLPPDGNKPRLHRVK